jgi:Holliday junction resolvasome RuvABC endonuclease subunit
MKYAGLDFSLTSPAYATYDSKKNKLRHQVLDKKFLQKTFKKDYKARNRYIINALLEVLKDCDIIYMEDYAFAACGRITDIAEVMGAIKYQLPETCDIILVSPSSLKKAVTGKGNATKEAMIKTVEDMGIKVINDDDADACGLLIMNMAKKGKVRKWDQTK